MLKLYREVFHIRVPDIDTDPAEQSRLITVRLRPRKLARATGWRCQDERIAGDRLASRPWLLHSGKRDDLAAGRRDQIVRAWCDAAKLERTLVGYRSPSLRGNA